MPLRDERIGETCMVVMVIMEGLFPVLNNYAVKIFSPLVFQGVSILIAALALFLLLLGKRSLCLPSKELLLYCFLTALFTVSIPAVLLLYGTQSSSGINTALLLQTQMVFALLFFGVFMGERWTVYQLLGAFVLMLGSVLVLYNGTFVIAKGELLIILACVFFPFGNHFAKIALQFGTTLEVLFFRYVIGALIIVPAAFILEEPFTEFPLIRDNLPLFLVIGIVLLVFGRILLYEAFRRLPVGRAMFYFSALPAVSMMYAYWILKEVPTTYQWGGLFVTLVGLILLLMRSKIRVEELP